MSPVVAEVADIVGLTIKSSKSTSNTAASDREAAVLFCVLDNHSLNSQLFGRRLNAHSAMMSAGDGSTMA